MSSSVSDRNLSGKDFAVGISPQTAYGAINASPVFRPVRRTTGKPKTAIAYTQDDSVTTDNQGVDNIQDSTEYTMELSSSMSKQSIFLLGTAIHGDFVNYTNTASTYVALADGFTVPALAYAALSVGDAFWVTGFAGATINGFYIVSSKAASNKIVTTIAPAATEPAGASVTLVSNKCKNGLAPTYFTVQQSTATSTTPIYDTYYDMIVNTLSVEIGETGITRCNFNMVGERKLAQTTALSGQTYSAKLSDRSVSASQDITDWYVDGIKATCIQKNITINIDNGYAGDDAAACARQYARGQFAVSGSASLRSKLSAPLTWRTYYEQSTRKSMGVLITHPNSTDQTFVVMMQNAITEHNQADGANDVANHEVSFAAEGHAATSSTIMVFTNWNVSSAA
jgi:hypothetical protein